MCIRDRSEVDTVAKSLKKHGFDAAPIHGDLDQSLRMKTLAAFRSGELKLLVASDVAARGLDIPDVSHVFNYDVAHHADDYVHRIGRTGRAGKLGQTFMIVTPGDDKSLDKVLKLIKMDPQELKLDLSSEGGARKSAPDAVKPAADAEDRPSRSRGSRSRKAAPVDTPTTTDAEARPQAELATTDDPTGTDEAKPRRSRSRRSPKADAAPVSVPIKVDAPMVAAEPARTARATPEPQLRQADRRPGGRSDRDQPLAREGVGFGSDIPAFLRRAPTR